MTATPPPILIIDDDPQIREFLAAALTAMNYQSCCAATGEQGLRLAAETGPQLVLLDLAMPGINGLETCRRLREWYLAPIIVLSASAGEAEKISALQLGADDYVTKPFTVGELLARIQAHLRRAAMAAAPHQPPELNVGPLMVDRALRHVELDGREIKLTQIEYAILVTLAKCPGCVVKTHEIQAQVWKPGGDCDERTLRVHVSNLRRKLQLTPSTPPMIVTELGIGYRLQAP